MPEFKIDQYVAGSLNSILDLGIFLAHTTSTTSTQIDLQHPTYPSYTGRLIGTGLTYNASGNLTGGHITDVEVYLSGSLILEVTGDPIYAPDLEAAVAAVQSSGDYSVWDALIAAYSVDYDSTTVPSGEVEVEGTANDDTFTTNGADSYIAPMAGNDTINGGSGFDQVNYANETGGSGININLALGTGTDTYGDTDTFTGSIEAVRGSQHADTVIGDGGYNVFRGLAGNDFFNGAGGIDEIRYDRDANYGGGAGVTVDLDTGTGTGGDIQGSATDGFGDTDTLVNVENIRGSDSADSLTGSDENNRILGRGGNDMIFGEGGDDRLNGEGGNDTINPGDNTGVNGDLVIGSTGNDTIVYTNSTAGFQDLTYDELGSAIVATINGVTNSGSVNKGANGTDTIVDIDTPLDLEAFSLFGTASDDTFNLTLDTDQWMSVRGGVGDDTINITSGFVRVDYRSSSTGINANLGLGTVADGFGSTDTLTGAVWEIRGSDHADTMLGSAGNESFIGRAGDDNINGAGGFDRLRFDRSGMETAVTVNLASGTATGTFNGSVFNYTLSNLEWIRGTNSYNDSLTGSGANERFEGRGGNDSINAAGGADELFGDDGHDDLAGGAGADMIDGGSGWDTANYTGSSAAVTVNLGDGAPESGGDAQGDVLSNIEHVQGSAHSDSLTGSGGVNFLYGNNGHDDLEGAGGADRIEGGLGWDTAVYTSSDAAVNVNLGDGLLESGGHAEDDLLTGIEHVRGSNHSDMLTGDSGINYLYGGNGHDILDGRGGADRLVGEGGWDTARYLYSAAAVVVNLGDGLAETGGDAEGDTLFFIEHVEGSNHSDTLTGSGGVNFLYGNNGHDGLEGAGGADRIDGGLGWDTAIYASSNAAVTVNLGDGMLESGGHAEDDLLVGIEHVQGSNHSDTLTGDAGINYLYGGNGHDLLQGAGGADRLFGDGGWDTATYAGSTAAVMVNLGDGLAESGGDAEGDLLFSIEHLNGSNHNDSLTGSSGINYIFGGHGHDRLEGGGGADRLDGWTGWDTAAYTTSDAAVTVNLGDGLAESGGHAQGDILLRIEHVEGSGFSDTIIGSSGINYLYGGNGHDLMEGGAGADRIDGQGGWDTASYAGSSAGVTVNLGDGLTETGGDAQGDLLIRIEHLNGSGHADSLTGSAGINYIDGDAGDDYLAGGGGNDRLTGGADADTFHFETGDGDDMILDFEDGIDEIEIGPGATAFGDLTITDSGADALVEFSDVSILVVGIDHTLLTTDDFTFV